MAGPAVCLRCSHDWVAVAPLGTTVLTCPSCRSESGVFNVIRYDGKHVACGVCGNDFFRYSQDMGWYCPGCGEPQDFGFGPSTAG